MKGGVTLTSSLILDPLGFASADIATSTIFKYAGDYLDLSITVVGKYTEMVEGAVVQGLVKFDGTRDQKQLFAWAMKGGVSLTAALILDPLGFASADIATSTIFKYAGDYLDLS